MPNHVYNVLDVVGDEKELKRFKDTVWVKKLNNYTRVYEYIFDFHTTVTIPKDFTRKDNWLEWVDKNWGTRWNAYTPDGINSIVFEEIDKENIIFAFCTAWTPPTSWVINTLELFPSLKVKLIWLEENCRQGKLNFSKKDEKYEVNGEYEMPCNQTISRVDFVVDYNKYFNFCSVDL